MHLCILGVCSLMLGRRSAFGVNPDHICSGLALPALLRVLGRLPREGRCDSLERQASENP
jgi:hypothetical protein